MRLSVCQRSSINSNCFSNIQFAQWIYNVLREKHIISFCKQDPPIVGTFSVASRYSTQVLRLPLPSYIASRSVVWCCGETNTIWVNIWFYFETPKSEPKLVCPALHIFLLGYTALCILGLRIDYLGPLFVCKCAVSQRDADSVHLHSARRLYPRRRLGDLREPKAYDYYEIGITTKKSAAKASFLAIFSERHGSSFYILFMSEELTCVVIGIVTHQV